MILPNSNLMSNGITAIPVGEKITITMPLRNPRNYEPLEPVLEGENSSRATVVIDTNSIIVTIDSPAYEEIFDLNLSISYDERPMSEYKLPKMQARYFNADLKDLKVNAVTLVFDPDIINYYINTKNKDNITVSFALPDGVGDNSCTINGNGKIENPDGSFTFTYNATPITITVTADSGIRKTYTLNWSNENTGITEISSAAITVTAPANGATPATSATITDGENFEVTNVTWISGGSEFSRSAFLPNAIYTVKVTLTADDGYVFSESLDAEINTNTLTDFVFGADGTTVTLTYTFPATAKSVGANVNKPTVVAGSAGASGFSISLSLVAGSTTGQNIQYAVTTLPSTIPTSGWTTVTPGTISITGLTHGTQYYIYARSAESETHSRGTVVSVSDAITLLELKFNSNGGAAVADMYIFAGSTITPPSASRTSTNPFLPGLYSGLLDTMPTPSLAAWQRGSPLADFNFSTTPITTAHAASGGVVNFTARWTATGLIATVAANDMAGARDYVNANNGSFTMAVKSEYPTYPVGNNIFTNSGSTLKIIGLDEEQLFQLSGTVFTINGANLLIGNNVRIYTSNNTSVPMIIVNSGNLTMLEGSRITSSFTVTNANGGCIVINSGGTFTMDGGIIDGLTSSGINSAPVLVAGTFIMNKGTITGCYGPNARAVRVNSGGWFTMSGGSISDNRSVFVVVPDNIFPDVLIVVPAQERHMKSGGNIDLAYPPEAEW